tara:strand:+ start:418 stop:981 length:564 start_codon:yes stop_codon:yes gene_type:complete
MIRNWIKKIVNAQIDDRLMDGIDYDQLSEKLSEVPDLVQELSKYFDIDEALSHVADNIDLYDLANHIDVHDVAYNMDACDVAGELDLQDVAYELEERMEMDNIEDKLVNKLLQNDVHRKVAELLWDRNESEIMDYTLDNFEFDYDKYVIDNESLVDAIIELDGRMERICGAFDECFGVIKNLTKREE